MRFCPGVTFKLFSLFFYMFSCLSFSPSYLFLFIYFLKIIFIFSNLHDFSLNIYNLKHSTFPLLADRILAALLSPSFHYLKSSHIYTFGSYSISSSSLIGILWKFLYRGKNQVYLSEWKKWPKFFIIWTGGTVDRRERGNGGEEGGEGEGRG